MAKLPFKHIHDWEELMSREAPEHPIESWSDYWQRRLYHQLRAACWYVMEGQYWNAHDALRLAQLQTLAELKKAAIQEQEQEAEHDQRDGKLEGEQSGPGSQVEG